jgi:hypothetical protein
MSIHLEKNIYKSDDTIGNNPERTEFFDSYYVEKNYEFR